MSLGTVATFLLIPPVNLLPMAMGGLVVARWRPRLGWAITAVALVFTWIFSTAIAATLMTRGLEAGIIGPPSVSPEAIVILSSEMHHGGPGGIVVGYDAGPMTLERLRAGARLARQTRLPILVSGGDSAKDRPSLAEVMSFSLLRDFSMQTTWLEKESVDTWQNATLSAEILLAENIRSIYLVTDAWHMRRAMIAFRHAGITVVAAPVQMQPELEIDGGDFLPTPKNWMRSYLAIHEWIGCLVYALKARFT